MNTDELDDWAQRQRRVWDAKSGLRAFYREAIFRPMIERTIAGPTLELGAGPGFLAAEFPKLVALDIAPYPGIAVCGDAHALPFADGAFANVVAVDFLHHCARPGAVLREAARVLAPGGRLVFNEPWTGAFGTLIYRYFHHEGCAAVPDPWHRAMPDDKSPLDGNATIPKALFVDRAGELAANAAGLRLDLVRPFGALSYLASGGFKNWGLGAGGCRALARLEARLPSWLMRHAALRVLVVLSR